MSVVPAEELPLGFRFYPSEEELVGHYLRRKISGHIRPDFGFIPEIDIYKYEPWDLPDKSLIKSDDREWFFFSQNDRKYLTGHRSNRATKTGYWKATGRDRVIRSKVLREAGAIGMKKILVFHQGRAPKGVNTNWIMHEYRVSQPEFGSCGQGGYVLYRLFRKAEEKNVCCNGNETERSGLSFLPTSSSPGDTHHEGDDFEELDAPIMAKPIQEVYSVSALQEQQSLSYTVENQSSGIIKWLADSEDHASIKVEDKHCKDQMALDVEDIRGVKEGESMVNPPLDDIPMSVDNLAPISSAANVELADNQTVVEDSASESRVDIYPSCIDPNLCHTTADGSRFSCKLKETEELCISLSAFNQTQVFPVGFRFHPTDEELVNYYLKRKLNGQIREIEVIPEVDICKCEPWDLPYKSPMGVDASEWFFFSLKGRKYPTGNRSNRATKAGYWKVSGRDRSVRPKSPAAPAVIGMKKSLIYYHGRAPKGVHTYWVMHEYCATEPEFEYGEQAGLVIYRLFRKVENSRRFDRDEMERSASSPTKSSPGDTEQGGDAIEEHDAQINHVSPVSDLHEEQQSLSNTVDNQPSGAATCRADKADFSSPKPEVSFSNSHMVVDLDSDQEVKAGENLVRRRLSSLFTSKARRKPPPQINRVGPSVNAIAALGNPSAPIASAAPALFSVDQTLGSVSSMADTSQPVDADSTVVSRLDIHPSRIDLSLGHPRASDHLEDNGESHPSSSTFVGQIRDSCLKASRAASCSTQSSTSAHSTDSSDISVHLVQLRSLFSKPLSELTLGLLMDGAVSAKIVASASGMHKDLAKHLESVIDHVYALRVHVDHQNHIIGEYSGPIRQLERLEADMPRFYTHLESLKLDIDHKAALVLQRRLQFGGAEDDLAELRDELARVSSVVVSMERQMKKLHGEKSRYEFIISLARDFIKKLETDFAALAQPYRDYFYASKVNFVGL
ncbi:NAC domain-containing protein 62-like [Iris pallida]|uniref:NAC domain-containing protein 62-like n=1 Tax=Iris pallida TaxID=29817 RepID=A0AAX6GQS4_IRIPA|nr:NAC domain-containing protein 62-like [Iris pallida]